MDILDWNGYLRQEGKSVWKHQNVGYIKIDKYLEQSNSNVTDTET